MMEEVDKSFLQIAIIKLDKIVRIQSFQTLKVNQRWTTNWEVLNFKKEHYKSVWFLYGTIPSLL